MQPQILPQQMLEEGMPGCTPGSQSNCVSASQHTKRTVTSVCREHSPRSGCQSVLLPQQVLAVETPGCTPGRT